MSNVAILTNERLQFTDLNALLLESHKYGKMRISRADHGWYCTIEMNTNTTGTSFAVKSEFDHATPLEAVQICFQRMHAALKTLGKEQTNGK